MAGISSPSVYWLKDALEDDPGPACPPLVGDEATDICVVGGGFTGLWTAIEIKRLIPEAGVTLLEADACGFGASGRNGGWATSWFDELDRLVERFGPEEGVRLADWSSDSIVRIKEAGEEFGFDSRFRNEGSLWIATSEHHDEALLEVEETCRRYGRDAVVRSVSSDEVFELTGSPMARGGLLFSDSAAVQPARLARGLRTAAIDLGVKIHEGSPMIALERSDPAVVRTSAGYVEADQVVLATNVWSARVRELRRAVFIVGTQIVITEPLGERMDEPWANGLLFGDARMFVHYAQVTPDRRIAFGRGGGAISVGGRVIPKHFVDPETSNTVADDFRAWFPELADVRLTHGWGGPVDRAPGHLPFVGSLGDHENIHYGLGYSGNGVAPSNLIGRILARRCLSIEDGYSTCALVSGPPGYLPPEPFRFAGAALVRDAIQRSEYRQEAGHPEGAVGRLARRLSSFSIPAGKARSSESAGNQEEE